MNILVVKLSSFGDVLMVTPCLKALRQRFPEGVISVVIDEEYRDLIRFNPNVDHLVIRRRAEKQRRWKSWIQAFQTLRIAELGQIDLALDLQGNAHSAAWTYASRATHRGGLGDFRPTWEQNIPIDYRKHAVDLNASVLEAFDIPVPERCLELFVSEQYKRKTDSWMSSQGLPVSDYLIIHPFSAWKSKEWPIERYGELIERIRASYGIPIFITGGNHESERGRQLLSRIDCDDVYSLIGQTNLIELLCLINRSRLLISGDTGVMHAASALSTPSLSLFGPTWVGTSGPRGQHQIVIQERIPEHHLAYRSDSNQFHISAIEVQTVFESVSRLLELSPSTEMIRGGVKRPNGIKSLLKPIFDNQD